MHHWVTAGLLIALMGTLSASYWFRSARVPWPSQLSAFVTHGGVGGVMTEPLS